MKLTLSPMRGLPGQAETTLSVAGDVLTVDGVDYDLSPVPEGGEATADEGPFVGPIRRVAGQIEATVQVILGDDAAGVQSADLADWTLTVASGAVAIPAARKEGVEA